MEYQLTIVNDFLAKYTDERVISATGLLKWIFSYIYLKYCGPHTPIPRPLSLWRLLLFYKSYPIQRLTPEFFHGSNSRRSFFRTLRKRERWLSNVIDELGASQAERFDEINRIPLPFFDARITGIYDVTPVYIHAPKNRVLNSKTYSGKYKGNVLKIQLWTDLRGRILWYSGPHLGSPHDIYISYHTPPPLLPHEKVLADLGYVGQTEQFVHKKKRYRGVVFTEQDEAYNAIMDYYRATIENVNCYIKKYAILQGTYRGKLLNHHNYLARAIRIIIHLSAVHLYYYPHKNIRPLFINDNNNNEPNYEEEIIRRVDIDWEEKEEIWDPAVGTGMNINNFHVGQRVQFRHNEEWWSGKISYISQTRQTISIRPHGSAVAMSGYNPKHVRQHR